MSWPTFRRGAPRGNPTDTLAAASIASSVIGRQLPCSPATLRYFCVPEVGRTGCSDPEVAPLDEPIVPELELPLFIASKMDMPCGPMVITTGFPSFDFAWTTKDSATTSTSVNPALCKSSLIFWTAAMFRTPHCPGHWPRPEEEDHSCSKQRPSASCERGCCLRERGRADEGQECRGNTSRSSSVVTITGIAFTLFASCAVCPKALP
jgi:hypothetical protein